MTVFRDISAQYQTRADVSGSVVSTVVRTQFLTAVYILKWRRGELNRNTSQFGLVAEDVEKVNPDLVVRDKDGKPYSVRYDQERDVAQRVPQRASHSAGTESYDRGVEAETSIQIGGAAEAN
jgi:hypothetical protein